MITLHLKLQNEYLKLNDYIEDGNITWGKNGDDGVSVNLKNVPNGKNLLADSLGQELVAYRDGELAWKGFVSNVTENENGIELVGRGDFHRLEYIEDYGEFLSKTGFENWIEVSAENSLFYKQEPVTVAKKLHISASTLQNNLSENDALSGQWYDISTSGNHTFNGGTDSPVISYKDASTLYKSYQRAVFEVNDYIYNTTFTSTRSSESILLVFDASDFGIESSTMDLLTFGNYPTNGYKMSVDSSTGNLTIQFSSGGSIRTVPLIYTAASNGVMTLAVVFDTLNIMYVYLNDDLVLTTGGLSKGTAPSADVKIGPISSGQSMTLLEFIVYNGILTPQNVTNIYNYYVSKYTFESYYPQNRDIALYSQRYNVVKGTISFENNCYIEIPNGSSFLLNQAVIATYKVPLSSNAGIEFAILEYEQSLPAGFSLYFEFYNKSNKLIEVLEYGGVSDSAVFFNTLYEQAYSVNVVVALIGAYSFTNTASDGTYFVNIKRFRAQSLDPWYVNDKIAPIDDAPNYYYFPILNDGPDGSPTIYGNNSLVYTNKNDKIVQGQVARWTELGGASLVAYGIIKEVQATTFSGIPATLVTSNVYNFINSSDIFYVLGLTTGQIVEKVLDDVYGKSIQKLIIDPIDDVGNADYGITNANEIVKSLAENVDYRYYMTGGRFYFIKTPPQSYYLMQDSKNISQSFDKLYTKIRTKFSSIYGFENVSDYSAPANKYNVTKSKVVEQGTLSKTLADLIAETVAEESVRNVVKVIPQSGELYNEYGAIVRDPQINSAVILKNVVPELIGLGDKTYYLSQIKYDFATGKYEYVIDEPELTFELILERTSG